MPRIYPKNGTKFNRGCRVCGHDLYSIYPDENIELTPGTRINEGLELQGFFRSRTAVEETVSRYTNIDAVCPNCGNKQRIGHELEPGSMPLDHEDWL